MVSGLRRSGNHFVVQWLVNSIEGNFLGYEPTRLDRLARSSSGAVWFINDLPKIKPMHFIRLLLHFRINSSAGAWLIVSIEDQKMGLSRHWWRTSRLDNHYFIHRNPDSIIASRFKASEGDFLRGRFRSAKSFDFTEDVIDVLKCFYEQRLPEDIIRYEALLDEQDSTQPQILRRMGIPHDCRPRQSSEEGGGSSFKEVPTSLEMADRHAQLMESNALYRVFYAGVRARIDGAEPCC